jgi:hypothetical protein
MEYFDQNNLLKAYQVGDNDIVAAFDEQDAIDTLVLYTGCSKSSDYDKDKDVTDLTDRLDEMLKDEDGDDLETLRDWLVTIDEPQYMCGWE